MFLRFACLDFRVRRVSSLPSPFADSPSFLPSPSSPSPPSKPESPTVPFDSSFEPLPLRSREEFTVLTLTPRGSLLKPLPFSLPSSPPLCFILPLYTYPKTPPLTCPLASTLGSGSALFETVLRFVSFCFARSIFLPPPCFFTYLPTTLQIHFCFSLETIYITS